MKRYRADTVFYNLGKIIWLPIIIGGFWLSHGGLAEHGDFFACSLKRMTGVPCPGCGGTRAFCALFKGNVIQSFCYHPAVLFGVFAYLHFMGIYFYRKHLKKSERGKEIPVEWYVYGAVAVILVQWIFKLITIYF